MGLFGLCAVSAGPVRPGWFLGEPARIEPARFMSAVPARLLATRELRARLAEHGAQRPPR